MKPHYYPLRKLKSAISFVLSLCIATAASPGYADISQSPLLLGGGSVPGNLALVPSVEWPTVLSVANTGSYSPQNSYIGYFNSNKCYIYDQVNHWFEPSSAATSHICSGSKQWSGNFLNWAATPTIDPFRSALTGGHRYLDTATQTVLQKARHDGQNSAGNRIEHTDTNPQGLISQADIAGATPASSSWANFYIRLQGQGHDMLFSNWKDGIGGGGSTGEKTAEWTNYEPDNNLQWEDNRLKAAFTSSNQTKSVYRVKIRVKVCDPIKGLEPNCELYPSGNYKPTGLLQQYSGDLRYSVFGYLNDGSMLRDGGVLRAQQKFIAPGATAPEWNASTGVMEINPDGVTSSLGRPISNSGVMNYLNKFGELNTNNFKSHDPVSELYYTALRYFKNQANVSTYSTPTPSHNSSPNADTLDRWHDGFPVITNWNDPIQYACQKNVILGIGDTNTHRDKNLPGNSVSTDEPSVPAEVRDDTTINVVTATQKVAELEGISIATPFNSGRRSSAYIAGLAYDANTKDLRADHKGRQSVSTYWVDVREGQSLAGRSGNQYWLAAKYGGFKVPKNFGDPYERTTALETEWWRTNTDMLATGYPRPDNFFVASDAANMVQSLRKAFAQIANEVESTTASLATNSTRLETDTALFQSRLDSRFWSGDLLARRVDDNGVVASDTAWSAAQKLDSLSSVDSRTIFTVRPATTAGISGESVATNGVNFDWNGLDDTQRSLLQLPLEATTDEAQRRLAYLRGDRTNEITSDNRTRPFRQRGSRLGDIVNSDPQYIHHQDFGYSRLSWGTNGAVGKAYTAFRASSSYQNRTPTVIVGANDGMLHGFDAQVSDTAASNGGSELFAYVPNSVFSNLINLTDPAYSHRYYVDGTPRISDVWIGGSWKTMVVGTTGAGGNSVFALDVTNPANMNSNSVMWEFSHPDMGYTIGQPSLVALPNEKFGVIVSSGYHDTAPEDGKVWILDAADGSIIQEIELPTTGNLGSPLASDTDYNQVADRVYVADTLGNVWRIDLTGSNPSNWDIPDSLGDSPLFVAKIGTTRQAITAPLSSAFNDKGEHMIFFGTGSFYRDGDNEIPESPPVDTFYGIIDRGQAIDGRATLLKQTVIREATLESGLNARAITDNALTTQAGWYIDLGWIEGTGNTGAKGERVIAKPTLRTDRVIFTTMTPSANPCEFGGTSFIMAMNLSSGSRLNYVYFDTDRDGAPDDGDTTTIGDDGNAPWSGISDTDDGVSKGVTPLLKLLCFAGSAGAAPQCIPVAGSQRFGRHSWREAGGN
ncbi:pilus assembly protein [Stutzerimonas stutzeri]|uniref:pilus assembly protein n=1 Tax=Stutzerimonas stutzeri TaxID=316 RepID=UPI000300272A|nr:PilC/PilY family type IV pilus protein [Stutzerimonas stutzeri]